MAGRDTVGVLLVCEDTLERAGLKALLGDRPGVDVIGEAGGLADVPEMSAEIGPDVIVDIEHSIDTHAAEPTARMIKRVSATSPARMLILASASRDFAIDVMRSGSCTVIDRKISSDELVAAIRMAAAGYMPVRENLMVSLARAAIRLQGTSDAAAENLARLTKQERRVLIQLIQGQSNPEIASDLTVAESTVKSHVQNILKKLSLRDRAQIIIYAYEGGLIDRRWAD